MTPVLSNSAPFSQAWIGEVLGTDLNDALVAEVFVHDLLQEVELIPVAEGFFDVHVFARAQRFAQVVQVVAVRRGDHDRVQLHLAEHVGGVLKVLCLELRRGTLHAGLIDVADSSDFDGLARSAIFARVVVRNEPRNPVPIMPTRSVAGGAG